MALSWTKPYAGVTHYDHPRKFLCTVCDCGLFAEAKVYSRIPCGGAYPVSSFEPAHEAKFFRDIDSNHVEAAKNWCETKAQLWMRQ